MIKLTIRSTANPKTFLFDQPVVTIGTEKADLPLQEDTVQPCHITILEEKQRFVAINSANDPFASLNSLPFGKKVLNNQDVIQVGNTQILFEGEHLSPLDVEALFQELETLVALENEEKAAAAKTGASGSDNNELSQVSSEQSPAQLQEAQSELSAQETPDNASNLDTPSITIPVDASYYGSEDPPSEEPPLIEPINDIDEEAESRLSEKDAPETADALVPSPRSNWRFYLAFFLACCMFMSLVATILYFKVLDESDEEKIKAAEAVADVGMALAYAQVHHIKPQKQNWSDPEFLKNNLASVLSSEYPALSHIDHQGQLATCPYIVRIYTSGDLSQFLVIAQPEPSLLQWLVPKASIVIDSMGMEMRHLYDLKALNRLLVNPNTLDGANAVEISYLVKQGEIIPLHSLEANQANQGFVPPKLLALSYPGSENLVYNAPRYYHFGESIMNRAVQCLEAGDNEHEIARLQQQIAELTKYPDIVLYSSQGIQKAIQAQKALAAFAPESKFITAYLNFNTHGEMTSSHLVYNDTQMSNGPPSQSSQNEIALLSEEEQKYADTAETTKAKIAKANLVAERRQRLNAISEQMNAILQSNNEAATTNFSEIFSEILMHYEEVDAQYANRE